MSREGLPSRRDVVRGSLGAAALLLTDPRGLLGQVARNGAGRLRDGALAAARWLESVEQRSGRALVWPMAPDRSGDVVTSLYSGTPGVVLFHLELYQATGERVWLDRALAGAEALAGSLPSSPAGVRAAGLYTGVAGAAFTLSEAYRIGGREVDLEAAQHGLGLVRATAVGEGAGVQWSEVNDIIGGTAGIALFLLYAERVLGDRAAGDLARRAGRRLVEVALPTRAGLEWKMSPTYERRMPNFSHGTAGIAYTLATLHEATGDDAFLEAALRGARQLLDIGRAGGDTFLVYHHDGDGEDLFYLSWCHGPPGTARLFYRLYGITKEAQWLELVRRSANGVVASGIPEQRTPGFWNNISQCCGNAGVAEFFLDLHGTLREPAYLAFAQRNVDDLLRRGTEAGGGMKWVQAENRVSPQDTVAQTGLMQGAAGVGLLLLHLDGVLAGRRPAIVLPDTPFAR